VIAELPLAAGQVVVAFTDGLAHAGDRRNLHLDPLTAAAELAASPACTARELAESLLARALDFDENRPGDDTTVAVVCVSEMPDPVGPQVRRMGVSFPVPAV
jgi:serine phosphatase RsbU (regulator of sigma subunit)